MNIHRYNKAIGLMLHSPAPLELSMTIFFITEWVLSKQITINCYGLLCVYTFIAEISFIFRECIRNKRHLFITHFYRIFYNTVIRNSKRYQVRTDGITMFVPGDMFISFVPF